MPGAVGPGGVPGGWAWWLGLVVCLVVGPGGWAWWCAWWCAWTGVPGVLTPVQGGLGGGQSILPPANKASWMDA